MLYLKCNKDKKESEKMKKINMNSKGFTLIELLAVITIMGILMMVAIPSVTRTIENSRRDTYADLAKSYINTLRNSVLSDELKCGDYSVGATPDGVYYFAIDSENQNTKDLMESGGTSSWSNAAVSGYVAWEKKSTAGTENQKTTTTYAIFLVDKGKHGIDAFTKEKEISRSKVSAATTNTYTALSTTGNISDTLKSGIKTGFGMATSATPVQCTLK